MLKTRSANVSDSILTKLLWGERPVTPDSLCSLCLWQVFIQTWIPSNLNQAKSLPIELFIQHIYAVNNCFWGFRSEIPWPGDREETKGWRGRYYLKTSQITSRNTPNWCANHLDSCEFCQVLYERLLAGQNEDEEKCLTVDGLLQRQHDEWNC